MSAVARALRLRASSALQRTYVLVDNPSPLLQPTSFRHASSCCPPPKVSIPLKDQAASLLQRTHGRKFANTSDDGDAAFPDSWVEPDALMEFAELQEEAEHPDALFEAEMGSRNRKWREETMREHPSAFEEMGAGQAPRFLWIGCCDSRVAPENMIGARPGEIFVHRNIANMVISTDTNLRSALLYAVNYLKVQHVIVCGHYDCGGVKAAMTRKDHTAPLESWLTNIRDVYRLHQEELEAIVDFEERHKRLVELNVIEQCLNLFKTGDVQRKRTDTLGQLIADGQDVSEGAALPRIHGMVFSPGDGKLRRLPVDFKKYMRQYKNVYNMYDAADVFASYNPP